MAKINTLFQNLLTQSLDELTFVFEPGRNNLGDPIFDVQSVEEIPNDIEIRTILYPEIYPMSASVLEQAFDTANRSLRDELRASGMFFEYRPAGNTQSKFIKRYELKKAGENTYYSYAYQPRYVDPNTINSIYDDTPVETGISVLSKIKNPDPTNLYLTAKLRPSGVAHTDMLLKLEHTYDVINDDLSDPYPYRVFITDQDKINYSISGVPYVGGIPGNLNYQSDSTFNIVLPYKIGDDPLKNYDISLYYTDQLSNDTNSLRFNTTNISKTNDDWNTGQDIDSFINKKLSSKTEIPIKNDIHTKKRYTIGIDDIGIVNESFVRYGVFESNYYTIDDPIYTFFLKSSEIIPNYFGNQSTQYDLVKYYVQFHNQDWIRISPLNRSREIDTGGKSIPKFLILDNLNIGSISSELAEFPYDFPVFSFKIKIEFDLRFQVSNNFISPAIDYYECHVTDRKSFLRI